MIEKKLHESPLLSPSAALDQKIHALIEDSAPYRTNLIWRPIPLWTSVAACVVFALLGFFADRWIEATGPKTESKQAVYIMEPTEALRNVVHAKTIINRPGFFQTTKASIDIVTPSKKRSKFLSLEEGL